MVIAVVLLAVLFLLGFFNTLFHIPPKKFLVHLQTLLYTLFPTTSSSSSIMTAKATNSLALKSGEQSKKKDRSTQVTVELERVFATFDKNGDGFITRQELAESLRNIGIFSSDKDIESMIEKLDINGDGSIDIQEFEAMYASMGGLGEDVKEEEEEVELRDAFGVFDGNNDGLITVEELGSVLNSLGIKKGIKAEDCMEMIKNVDMDGDGMVNFDEFKHMMKSGGKLISVS